MSKVEFTKRQFIAAYNDLEKYPTIKDLADLFGMSERTIAVHAQHLKKEGNSLISRARNMHIMLKQKSKASIIKRYSTIAERTKVRPGYKELKDIGVTSDRVRAMFGALDNLHEEAKKTFPDSFISVIDETLFTPKIFKELKSETKKYKRFVITTAVVGCIVDQNFLKAIDMYCEENDALLLVVLAADPAAKVGWNVDPVLKDRQIVFDNLSLNKKLFINTIKLSAKHIDPITGLKRIGQRNGSFIYASPKQRLQYVANSVKKSPIALMTTGAITKPNYTTDKYMSDRTATIADYDHVMGGIIVEIENDKTFHFRQIQSDHKGGFVDLGKFYSPQTGIFEFTPKANFGDWHSGETSPDARKGGFDVVNSLGCEEILLEDVFTGISINHHEHKSKVKQAIKALSGHASLEKEIIGVAKDLNDMLNLKTVKKIVVKKSNHDEFLNRYLDSGFYVDDRDNHLYSLDLAKEMILGRDPLKFAVEQTNLVKKFEKITWLERDEEYLIGGIECGQHGDLGGDGKWGSMYELENNYGTCVTGHVHTPEILRGVWRVGTFSHLRLGYTRGASSWMNTLCLVYPNGMRQLINILEGGKWRIK